MSKRKTMSKKLRFDVFKRDRFQCQYCGKTAPDAVLEVDHINPVSDGGSDEIMNLVTSCFDCNRGKGKRKLADSESLKKAYKQTADLQERREQIEMMMEWRNLEVEFSSNIGNAFEKELKEIYGITIEDERLSSQIKRSIKKYGYDLMIDVVEEVFDKKFDSSVNKWQVDNFIKSVRSSCFYKKRLIDNPELIIPYISAILSDKFKPHIKKEHYQDLLETKFKESGITENKEKKEYFDDMLKCAREYDDLNEFLHKYDVCINIEENN